ncbi:MAG: class I SAM-dependent methyltransferase [Lysobacter sp.]|nr:class I SAM-dependent methyltransferase [Lysobacter sp.]
MRKLASRMFWSFVESRLASNGKIIGDADAFTHSGFYSPVVDRQEVRARADSLWPRPSPCLGIDFNHDGQAELLRGAFAGLVAGFDYPQSGPPDEELEVYYDGNSEFSGMDARILFGLLRLWRPRRIIEVGSGYSTLLMVDVVRHYLAGGTRITAIEPFPRPFLHRLAGADIELLQQKVQDVDPAVFMALEPGDVLFIDSSHVSKTGSDVNHLVFEVLPRLKPGVHIHFHDIFLPFEYPQDWVLEQALSWNEQYLVRALLMFAADTWRVTLGCAYAINQLPEFAAPIRQKQGGFGGSLWLTKLG